MIKDNSFFDYLKNLFTKNERMTSVNTMPEMFMVLRFLSMHPDGFFVADQINRLNNKLPSWVIGCVLYHLLPKKSKAPFMEYIKSKKEEIPQLIRNIGEIFYCRPNQAVEICKLLQDQLVNINAALGIQEGETIGYKNKNKSTEKPLQISDRIAKWKSSKRKT